MSAEDPGGSYADNFMTTPSSDERTAPAPASPLTRLFLFEECQGIGAPASVFIYPDKGKEGIWTRLVREVTAPRLMVVPTTGEIHTECPDCRHAGCAPYEPVTQSDSHITATTSPISGNVSSLAKPEQPPVTAQELRRICMDMHLGRVTVEQAKAIRELANWMERRQ